jgi:hypothetical protein
MQRVLVIGGYGLVGSHFVRQLRTARPNAALLLGGRSPEAGEALAAEIGGAQAIRFDVADPEAFLRHIGRVDLIVSLVTDPGDFLVLAAIRNNIPHIGITRTPSDVAPLLFAARARGGAPVLVAGHWQGGALTWLAGAAASKFLRAESVALAALYDPLDPIGRTAREDAIGFSGGALAREAGRWRLLSRDQDFLDVAWTGATFRASPLGVLDVPSLFALTAADNIRFDLGVTPSSGTLSGSGPSHDLFVEVCGVTPTGTKRVGSKLTAPRGQAWLTGTSVALLAERLLASGRRLSGVQFPETVIRPADALRHLGAAGAIITSLPLPVLS